MSATYPSQTQEPGAYVQELLIFSPETQLGYNVDGVLIKIKKKTATGATFEREILDKDISDYTVVKWDIITRWRQTR